MECKWVIILFDKQGEVYDKAVVIHETLEQSQEDIFEQMANILADKEGNDEELVTD
jgi:lipopolysaccharide biosynthesis regulator YciM